MLLPILPGTPKPEVFTLLNRVLLHFLQRCVHAKKFHSGLLPKPKPLRTRLWTSKPTKKKLRAVWDQLKQLTPPDRQRLYEQLANDQNISTFFDNQASIPTTIPNNINPPLYKLCEHLYSSASKYAIVETLAGESVLQHYNEFIRLNANICPCCATSTLAPCSHSSPKKNKWRGPYDHLLPKKTYSHYAVHPENLLPTCTDCNSKAKSQEDPVTYGSNNTPCISTYPYTHNLAALVGLKLVMLRQVVIKAEFTTSATSSSDIDRVNNWLRLYTMDTRTEGHLREIAAKIDKRLTPTSAQDLKEKINQQADYQLNRSSIGPWDFWFHKLYVWMAECDDTYFDLLWTILFNFRRGDSFDDKFPSLNP